MSLLNKKSYWYITILVSAIPVFIQVFLLDHYAVNIPYYDDFLWGVTFLKEHQELDFWGKIQHLFGQHNQHRVLWLRLVVITITELQGYLDFRTLTLIGNLGFFGLSLLYIRILSKVNIPWLYLVPIPFIIHDLSTFHNMFVSYGVPNMTVIFLALLCFYWTTSEKAGRVWWGLAIGILGTFTNGSGIIILPLAFLSLFFLKYSFKAKALYGACSVSTILGYFYSYQTDYSELTFTSQALPYFVEFMGSYFPFARNKVVQFFMVGFLIFAIVKTFRKLPLNRLHVFVMAAAAFLLGSGLLATLFRVIHHIDIPDWYYIYSYAFIALVYIWLQGTYKSEILRFGFFVVFFGIALFSYFYEFPKTLMKIDALQSRLVADAENYKRHGNWAFIPLKAGLKEEKKWQDNYDDLSQKGLVQLSSNTLTIKHSNEGILPVLKIGETEDEHTISFDQYADATFHPETTQSLIFIQNRETAKKYFVGTYHYENPWVIKLKKQNWFSAYGVGVLPKKYSKEGIPAGTYYCGVWLKNVEGQEKSLLSNEEIVIENW